MLDLCGLVGQGIANLIMTAKRTIKKSEEDIPVPPLIKIASFWGFFLAVYSNTRYQIINGLERLVEASPVAKRVPPVALAFTVGVRFANNIYGGMQFVEWAKLSGVQQDSLVCKNFLANTDVRSLLKLLYATVLSCSDSLKILSHLYRILQKYTTFERFDILVNIFEQSEQYKVLLAFSLV